MDMMEKKDETKLEKYARLMTEKQQIESELHSLESKNKNLAKEYFAERLLKEHLSKDEWSGVEYIEWDQCTPWNDGDETYFTIGSVSCYDKEESLLSDEDEDLDEFVGQFGEEWLKRTFGDSNRIRAYRNGRVKIDDYNE